MQPIAHPSPNFGPRREGLESSLIVLHYTAMQDPKAALERLCDPAHEVSAHYLIHRDGRLFQLVPEEMRAWHAGAGFWGGLDDINSRSIGIELDNDGASPFSEPQMATLESVLPQIMQRWRIAPVGVIGHSDMAPARKSDPGRRFDWARLARQGLSIWPEGSDVTVDTERFLSLLARVGYPISDGLNPVLRAFRQRFRPWQHGVLDARDMGIAEDLATRFGVDRPVPIA
ncbi:N-acetylmuramoyl-L-alanine amidase [Aliiroseovarius halocynthiae]|uniref:N-acetylmuramoyl-L-alanine amidase n=1 Tax=Aliiroseovarius halocynthiae TaxID=985055 RepID=A0A545SX18_9RHOB|nr:N-acetylmuramoyl-L-alanine amidase [Aliiroseovarius halocynthiae]TQV69512.1 N-acetylmuramoyl-L-alanine amidase [Aliiroseovarius halocynthiae]SMR70780.1 N-acetylmuramoyl-L-alanine amidase [Aliiroseovarius halocynthiae]